MATNYVVIQPNKQHFGNERNAFQSVEPGASFAGRRQEIRFDCPDIFTQTGALLMFRSLAVNHKRNVFTINGSGIDGGVPVSANENTWNGNVLVIPPNQLRLNENRLLIESRNENNGTSGNIDDFLLDNIVVVYKTNPNKIWTTVGSAGTLDESSAGKVFFEGSIVQMGKPIADPTPIDSTVSPLPSQSAVIRYNVTPEEGLFTIIPKVLGPGANEAYKLVVRCLATGPGAQVEAKLVEVDFQTGATVDRLNFLSQKTTNKYQVQSGDASFKKPFSFDFKQKAYFVEAKLSTSSIVGGSAAGISIIKIETQVAP